MRSPRPFEEPGSASTAHIVVWGSDLEASLLAAAGLFAGTGYVPRAARQQRRQHVRMNPGRVRLAHRAIDVTGQRRDLDGV
jgi:hypothetical protein